MSSIPKFFPYVGSGIDGSAGWGGLNPGGVVRTFDWLLNNVDESTFARQAREHGGGWLHNPFGKYEPMALDQLEKTRQHAAANPDNMLLQNSADAETFTEAASKFKREDLWLCCYVGGNELSMFPMEGETAEQWKDRAKAALAPILDATPKVDAIGFDAVLGRLSDAWHPPKYQGLDITSGPRGGMSLLIRELRHEGYQVFIEPFALESADWLSFCSACITDRTKAQKESNGWWVRDSLGNRAPVRKPTDHAGNPVVFLRNSWEKTDAEKLADVARANDEGYAATIVSHKMPGVG